MQPKGNDQRGYVIRGVFEDAYNYMKSGHLMRPVINKIVSGLGQQDQRPAPLRRPLRADPAPRPAERRQRRQYYAAPGHAVHGRHGRAAARRENPRPGLRHWRLLTCAIETVRRQQVKTVDDEQQLQGSIFGVEKKPLPHLLCTTNMILHGIDVPTNVRHDNTLSRPLRDYGRDRVDVILTNPPFGGMEGRNREQLPGDLPHARNRRPVPGADHALAQGRRPRRMVLPDGTLFGEEIKTRIKEQLLETCKLHTIVRLPSSVFAPYTGIKTNLLFFTRSPTTDVWFYEHPYPAGVKNYNKTKPMRIEEFAARKAWWTDRVENEHAEDQR